mmetsp:Transcript_52905/g.165551  ORF Transcript_52905/g.165551 Transcript_52905/m.165551 type:complete len:119 (-) Transcript_52905:320-676(-)
MPMLPLPGIWGSCASLPSSPAFGEVGPVELRCGSPERPASAGLRVHWLFIGRAYLRCSLAAPDFPAWDAFRPSFTEASCATTGAGAFSFAAVELCACSPAGLELRFPGAAVAFRRDAH